LLASYDDGNNTGFWDGLRPQRAEAWKAGRSHSKIVDPFIGDDDKKTNGKVVTAAQGKLNQTWDEYQAPRRMVDEIARQLQQMHGLDYTPRVKSAAFRDWGEDPYGGGWNSWNIGVRSWEVRDQITYPIPGTPLYICGEAYSDAQGWVEGALQTAEIMLGKFLASSTSAKQTNNVSQLQPS